MAKPHSFSDRHGIRIEPEAWRNLDELPQEARECVYVWGSHDLEWNSSDWSYSVSKAIGRDCDGIADEVRSCIYGSDWNEFYDIVEEIAPDLGPELTRRINAKWASLGVPWKISHGQVIQRNQEAILEAVLEGQQMARERKLSAAEQRLNWAWQDLHQRPEPNTSGAVAHAICALEAMARKTTGQNNKTMGQLQNGGHLKKIWHPELANAIYQFWKYSNDVNARHGKEDAPVPPGIARHIVHIAAATVALDPAEIDYFE